MIRFASVNDLEAISQLRYKMFENIGTTHLLVDNFLSKTIEYYSEQYQLGKCLHALKEDKGVIVGCAGGIIRSDAFLDQSFKKSEYGYIMDVYVEPLYRRLGLARSLTEKIIGWLRNSDIAVVKLHPSKFAGTLYKGLGFASSIEMSLNMNEIPKDDARSTSRSD